MYIKCTVHQLSSWIWYYDLYAFKLFQIWYNNVDHPKLSAYVKSHSWLKISGDHLVFPKEQSEFKGGANQYLDAIEEVKFILSYKICHSKTLKKIRMPKQWNPDVSFPLND